MKGIIVAGGKVYERCSACGKIVRVNKPLVGSLHVCAPEPDPVTVLSVRPA